MARCIFENLTPEQAIMLAEWYEGQGEQDADIWFSENDLEAPYVDCKKSMEILGNDDVVVYCK